MATTENELCIDESDLITSFSNPNYTPSCNSNIFHSKFDIQHNGNSSIIPASESYDELGNVQMIPRITGDVDSCNISLYHKEDSRSLTDSAISSPSSESSLASPCLIAPVEQNKPDPKETGVTGTRHPNNSEGDNKQQDSENLGDNKIENLPKSKATEELVLPPGWQKCEDKDGPYYWHIKSGTIQREPPELNSEQQSVSLSASLSSINVLASSPEASCGKSISSDVTEGKNLEKESKALPEQQYPIRFAVRSLGWVPILEEDLSQEKSSRAVNKCIVDLSSGKKDINDAVGRWGDGKYLFMDFDQENLSLIDPHDLTVLNIQPIKAIRVWGVGRDNDRDFAYVARDRISRKFMCHVFRCELPARHIASTLCEICKRVIAKRNAVKTLGNNASGHVGRPTDLPSLEKSSNDGVGGIQITGCDDILKNSSFPTPMDEPKKVMTCHYLGTTQVSMATGIEVLNGAIDLLNVRIPREKRTFVNVTVAPSTITITEHQTPYNIIAECRVRFLSFLGISLKNIKLCSFIMHTAQDQFVAHVFYCEPSAGALCKIIEAACKLRYQKCLDRTLCGSDSVSPLEQLQEHSESPSSATKGLQSPESCTEGSNSGLAHSLLVRGKAGLALSASVLSNAATSLKSGFIQTASSVKAGVATTSVAVKDELSNRASVAKDGITSAFESLRRKAGQYLPSDEQL